MNNESNIESIELQDRDISLFKFLRDHRTLHNYQIQRAFWPDKNIRAVDQRLKKLAVNNYIKHIQIDGMQPFNHYYLCRKGFNKLVELNCIGDTERLYQPEDINISSFFLKQTLIADIRISFHHFFGPALGAWVPNFEAKTVRNEFGITSSDPKTLATVIPDSVFVLKGIRNPCKKIFALRYHYFETKREEFTKRLHLFESAWSKHYKLIMAFGEADISNLLPWYFEDLKKYYAIDINRGLVKWEDVREKYFFADYKTLMETGELIVWTFEQDHPKPSNYRLN